MDVRRFFLAARKRWWVIALATVLGLVAAVGMTSQQQQQYRSSVTFFLSTPAKPADAYQASLYGQQLVNSYVKLLGSDELARRVIEHAGLRESPDVVAGKISGTAALNTVLLTARAVDSTPAGALRLTSSIAAVFGPLVGSLTNEQSAAAPSVVLTVVSGPTAPVRIAPQRKLNYLIGVLGGLVIGLAVVGLRELLDTTVRSDEQLAALDLAPLGSITTLRRDRSVPVMVGTLGSSDFAEDVRQLRTTLQFLEAHRPVCVMAVVSPEAGDGKSVVAINLALAFAEADRRTVLVDADLRESRVASYLGLDGGPGLSDVLAGRAELDTALQPYGGKDLQVLTGGALAEHPAELLGSRVMAELIARLRQDFDTVVIDTPALRPVADGRVTTLLSDGAIIVVRHGRTRRPDLQEAVLALRSVDAPLLGAVRTMVPLRKERKRPRATTKRHARTVAPEATPLAEPGVRDPLPTDAQPKARPSSAARRLTPAPAPSVPDVAPGRRLGGRRAQASEEDTGT